MLRKFWSEPLLHFLLLGLLLFGFYQLVAPEGRTGREITVTDGTVAMLSQRHALVWQRPPTSSELNALIEAHIREEILYREGVAMGLDQDDPVIRRRVLQKLEVLGEEGRTQAAPDDAELTAWLQKNAERYARPPVFSYQQLMFDPVRHGASLEDDFRAALARLNAGADPAGLGDSTLLPARASDVPLDQLARDYGEDFATAVAALPVGSWQGPVPSGFGVHIVRVDSRADGAAATLDEVRAAVERDWENERRKSASEAWYQQLRSNYKVSIEAILPGVPASAGP